MGQIFDGGRVMKRCLWKYHNSHDYWSTSCGVNYEAFDLGCKEIRVCPNFGREATTKEEE